MASFRLIDISTGQVTSYSLGNSPPYLAASHAWSEERFPLGVTFLDSAGRKALIATIDQRFAGEVSHCWVDTICIDQNSDADMNEQIPLMGQIFGGALAVIVILSCDLQMCQRDIHLLTRRLEPAVDMREEGYWKQSGTKWQNGKGRQLIQMGMRGLARLTTTAWATRVWTLQEYVLASQVIWIGQDLVSLKINDILFAALPDICDTLNIDECIGDEFDRLYGYLSGMATQRLDRFQGWCDTTRVMELLGNRSAELPRDEVYGIMAASGVEIPPETTEIREDAWSKWFEQAITQGHLRWLLMPVAISAAMTHRGKPSCILPPFEMRHKLSAGSALDKVEPLGRVRMEQGTAIIDARWIGDCQIKQRLGTVHEPMPNRIHRDITLILFGKGRPARASKIARAFGAGRYNERQLDMITQLLTRNWRWAVKAVRLGNEASFRMRGLSTRKEGVWIDFMEFQMGQLPGINEGIAYLAYISHQSVVVETVLVLPPDRPVPTAKLGVIDLGARTVDKRNIFMIVSGHDINADGCSAVIHKVAVTLPITGDYEAHIARLPLQEFTIGGEMCRSCLDQASG